MNCFKVTKKNDRRRDEKKKKKEIVVVIFFEAESKNKCWRCQLSTKEKEVSDDENERVED